MEAIQMKSRYFFRKLFGIAVVFSILLIAALIPLKYNNISTLSFFDVQSSNNPTFQVHPQEHSVYGEDWGEEVLITLTVDDPSNGTGVDYSDSQTAFGEVEFYIDFDIQPGFLFTMSDGIVTKTHDVFDLTVVSMYPVTDTVSGKSNDVSEIEVHLWADCNVSQYVTIDGNGDWTADFSTICDIDPWKGIVGTAFQCDEDGDKTLTKFPEVSFRVRPDEDQVSTRSWTEGVTVTLTIDDPGNGEGIDYTYEGTAPDKFYLSGVVDIVPGFRLTMTDGNFIKAHVVTELQMLSMDPESDQVSGLAAEGSEVVVQFWEDGGCNAIRYVTTDSSGNWSADFTEPGEHPRDRDICDIDEWEGNQAGSVVQIDKDYDYTLNWFPKGSFTVKPEDDNVEGHGWPENVGITMTIDNPYNGPKVDYEDTQISISTEDGTSVKFTTEGKIDIQPGFRVTMTDGNFIKAHVVTDLQVLSMDPVTDQVSGTATPNSRIRVRFWVGCNAVRDVTTDEDGTWTADFSGICNIDAFNKMRGHAKQGDTDDDSTRINFPNPRFVFGVFPEDDYTFSRNWPEGAEVTINIDDPGTTEEPDYTDTQISTKVDGRTLVEFNYADEIDIQPEFLVTVTDGNFTKGHVVTIFEVLDVDTEEDMISGIAEPFSQIGIRLSGVCEAKRTPSSDADGVWIADFSQEGTDPDEGQCNIDESVSGQAGIGDDDWDSTHYWIRNNIEITALENPVGFRDTVQVSAKFTDPTDTGTSDRYTARWEWGDGSHCETGVDPDCSITEPPFFHSGTVSGSHTYDEPGVYTLKLTISDNDDYNDEATYEFIVIFDPTGGFVTGGGWIDSPEGAYLTDPALSGKANFGFVSEYKKGASVPTGNTEFQFKAGDLNFHSSNYDWLVVTGSDYAKFKDTGTINGEGEYKFMLWAGDGTSLEGADTFRIKIWTENGSEVVVYDNGMDQEIGGGNIVVHIK
jgi:hypothetical protein